VENKNQDNTLKEIYNYWNTHTLGLQYATDQNIEVGSAEFFEHIRQWMNPYKFPWIMERIDREAASLQGKHLLEIGCGMGFDSLEFLKRGVKVTATDLTENAVIMSKKHFEYQNVAAEDVRVESVLDLSFADETFDAVWANGVLHATGDTQLAIDEVWRVLKPGGRAIISHFYRKPSWMYTLKQIPGVNIEFDEEDPPVNQFYTEKEIEKMFHRFRIIETSREHYDLLEVCREGVKAALYNHILKPVYNHMPRPVRESLAYKYSVVAIKR
jgi:2-polyprenyl-3-methyl-5-hydroxy-6-metoxy-1,4-benzoquinol methylase